MTYAPAYTGLASGASSISSYTLAACSVSSLLYLDRPQVRFFSATGFNLYRITVRQECNLVVWGGTCQFYRCGGAGPSDHFKMQVQRVAVPMTNNQSGSRPPRPKSFSQDDLTLPSTAPPLARYAYISCTLPDDLPYYYLFSRFFRVPGFSKKANSPKVSVESGRCKRRRPSRTNVRLVCLAPVPNP